MSKDKVKKLVKNYAHNLHEGGLTFKKVYLYGSYATGKNNKWSDIDVCVISDEFDGKNWDKFEQKLWRLRRQVDLRIEPIGMSTKEFNEFSPLASEIKKNGIAIAWV